MLEAAVTGSPDPSESAGGSVDAGGVPPTAAEPSVVDVVEVEVEVGVEVEVEVEVVDCAAPPTVVDVVDVAGDVVVLVATVVVVVVDVVASGTG